VFHPFDRAAPINGEGFGNELFDTASDS